MALDDDDWDLDLSAEELDSLERDAFQKIQQRNSSSASAPASVSSSSQSPQQNTNWQQSPVKPSCPNKVILIFSQQFFLFCYWFLSFVFITILVEMIGPLDTHNFSGDK